jgi:hypothetical protein
MEYYDGKSGTGIDTNEMLVHFPRANPVPLFPS